MKNILIGIFSIVLMTISFSLDAQTYTLTPEHDVWYKDNFNGGVSFNTDELQIRTNKEYAFLKFDLTTVSGNITSVSLEMSLISEAGGAAIDVFKSTENHLGQPNDWTENGGFNTSNRPVYTLADKVNTTAPSNYTVGSHTWTLNPAAFAGASEITLAFEKTDGARNVFASDEHGSTTGPVLTIVTDGGSSASCTDGIQNGNETGIDCGGSNCPTCPTCSDGIQNGNETGVDCGGTDCPDCPSNSSPIVSIDAPSDGAIFTVGNTINVTATANDTDGSIANVKLYNNGLLVSEDASAPYEWTLSNLAIGSYALYAEATDDEGANTQSATVNITVQEENTGGGSTSLIEAPATIRNGAYEMTLDVSGADAGANLDIQAQTGQGRTQINFIPFGSDTRAFVNVWNSSDADNKGMARLGARGSYGLLSATSGGNPVQPLKNVGIELDPKDELTGEVFQVATGGYFDATDVNYRPKAILFHVQEDGKLGISTTTPTAKLTVAGDAHIRKVKITVDAGADFVFQNGYEPPQLEEVAAFVKENEHLPGIASEKEMLAEGVDVGEFNIQLLQKIEEMTLYMIDFQQQMEALKIENRLVSL